MARLAVGYFCSECGVSVDPDDVFCDGIVCTNGHTLTEACHDDCRSCTDEQQTASYNRFRAMLDKCAVTQ